MRQFPLLICLVAFGLQLCVASKLKGTRPNVVSVGNVVVKGKRYLYKASEAKGASSKAEEAMFFDEGMRKGVPHADGAPVGRVSNFEELKSLFYEEKVEPSGYETTRDRYSSSIEEPEVLVVSEEPELLVAPEESEEIVGEFHPQELEWNEGKFQ